MQKERQPFENIKKKKHPKTGGKKGKKLQKKHAGTKKIHCKKHTERKLSTDIYVGKNPASNNKGKKSKPTKANPNPQKQKHKKRHQNNTKQKQQNKILK